MENSKSFSYQYSAIQNKEVESIRNKYILREESKIEKLRRLDMQVQTAGRLPALIIGVIGCLIFGIGMCFGLDVFPGADWLTLLYGGLGVIGMVPAYPLFRHIARKTRSELAPEILKLTEEMIGSK